MAETIKVAETIKGLDDISSNPLKADFPLLVKHPDLVYLDSAATAQRPEAVLTAERTFYETMNANPLRGLYSLSVEATQAIADARKSIAEFIGASDPDEVIFTRNATESLNLVASSLGGSILHEGDEVVISIMEHHSNLIPWQQVCRRTGARLVYMRPDAGGHFSDEEIEGKIGPKTKIVSVTQLSNVLGAIVPVGKISKRAHEVGAVMVVDGAQSAPHMKVDVEADGIDLFAFSGHKLGGPMGIGVLWGRRKILEEIPPFLTGGEMIDSVTEQDAVWAPIPQKFEAGTQDAAGIYATKVALDYINGIGIEQLESRERKLTSYLCQKLVDIPYVDVLGSQNPEDHFAAVSFNVGDIHPHDVSSILDMSNVAIRAGHHCAQPLLTWLGISSCCRASVAYYNEKEDIDKLVDAIGNVWKVFKGGK
ncbi:MAG: aminotransferase class V-fold PLP-dependent enzyme [Coriobacteriales bacterium]|jgi:cysteine desulfurase/selenocysteine lyase